MRLFGNRFNSGDNDFICSYGERLFWKDKQVVKIKELFEYMPHHFVLDKVNAIPESAGFGQNLLHILPLLRVCYNLSHEELLPDRPLYEATVRT